MCNGVVEGLRDIVWVDPDRFDKFETVALASRLEALNERLRAEHGKYVMVGPGRWGSSILDWEWLRAQHEVWRSGSLVHTRLEAPLHIVMDGRRSASAISLPDGRRPDLARCCPPIRPACA